MKSLNLSILFRAIRSIVPKFDGVCFHKVFDDIRDEFFSLIGTNLLSGKGGAFENLVEKINRVLRIGCFISPGKHPSSRVVDNRVDDFSLFVAIRILRIHLKFFSGYLMGKKLLFPALCRRYIFSSIANFVSF
jgi:hypothetical protein